MPHTPPLLDKKEEGTAFYWKAQRISSYRNCKYSAYKFMKLNFKSNSNNIFYENFIKLSIGPNIFQKKWAYLNFKLKNDYL